MRRSLNMGLLTVLVMASTAACGIQGITTLAKSVTATTLTIPLPLDGMSADKIAMTSLKNLGNATSVKLKGTVDDSGRSLQMNLTLVKGVGCTGTFAERGQGSFRLVVKGKTAWVKGDDTFWRVQGAGSGATMNTLADNYIKITKSTDVNQFASLCGVAGKLASDRSKATGMTRTKTIMNDQAVVVLKDTADKASVYVSNTTTPEILQINDPTKGGGSFTFSGFNQPVTITSPPTDQTLDGAQFGM
jgi:hypothetical protein